MDPPRRLTSLATALSCAKSLAPADLLEHEMRAEIVTMVDEIRSAVALIRRHL
jgi:hypothetical protein